MPADAEQRAMPFDGNLADLTARIRRHPDEARHLRVLELVRTMRDKWTAEPDPVDACDEFPSTAWLVRRKVEMVLPRPPREDAETLAEAPPADTGFLREAVEALRRRYQEASAYHFRMAAPPTGVHRSVAGATLQRLAAAWPRVRSRPVPPVVRVKADEDPVVDRVERWRQLLRGGPVRFPRPGEARSEVVGMFVALLGLWAGGEVHIRQEQPYSPLEVEAHAPGDVSP